MTKMFETVNDLLEKYIGGQLFFSELDKAVKFDADLLLDLIHEVRATFGEDVLTIASGEIGLSMHNLGIPVDFLVPGGLRHDPSKINLAPFESSIHGKRVVFIDDSYFSGRTVLVVREEISKLGGIFLGTYVAYDGAKHKECDVYSLYRYYEYHDALGRPLNKEGK